MNKRLKLWNITWATTTAGPSPDCNKRTEVFLFGCERAKNGNPCEGCFNDKLWDNSKAERDFDPIEMAIQIEKHAPNKYVTIGGGEPTDQMDGLILLCIELQKRGFHVAVYTWKSLKNILEREIITIGHQIEKNQFLSLLLNIDILIDGQFEMNERLYKENQEDGLLNSIGSGNQIIWDTRNWRNCLGSDIEGYALRDLDAVAIREDMELIYIVKSHDIPVETVSFR